jgi:hypothetical protein
VQLHIKLVLAVNFGRIFTFKGSAIFNGSINAHSC